MQHHPQLRTSTTNLPQSVFTSFFFLQAISSAVHVGFGSTTEPPAREGWGEERLSCGSAATGFPAWHGTERGRLPPHQLVNSTRKRDTGGF